MNGDDSSDDDWAMDLGDQNDEEPPTGDDDGMLAIKDGDVGPKIKNERVSIEKAQGRVQKLLADCQKAKLQVRAALANKKAKYYETLKDKLDGALEVIQASIDNFEIMTLKDSDEWLYMDLGSMKKQATSDISKINNYIASIKALT